MSQLSKPAKNYIYRPEYCRYKSWTKPRYLTVVYWHGNGTFVVRFGRIHANRTARRSILGRHKSHRNRKPLPTNIRSNAKQYPNINCNCKCHIHSEWIQSPTEIRNIGCHQILFDYKQFRFYRYTSVYKSNQPVDIDRNSRSYSERFISTGTKWDVNGFGECGIF